MSKRKTDEKTVTPTQAETEKVQKPKQNQAKAKYRQRRNNVSIYFLLWAAFSAMAFVVVVFCSVIQSIAFKQTYKEQVARELSTKGDAVKEHILDGIPEELHGNMSAYIRLLATHYNVNVYILDGEGNILFPQGPHFEGEMVTENVKEVVEELKKRLAEKVGDHVVYEYNEKYVYGAQITFYGNQNTYLYADKGLELMAATQRQLNARALITGIFVFVLTFAFSSAVSGWLTKPISEMTKKTRLLAHGDFNVDFHGDYYGEELMELADTLNFARDELSKTDAMQKELIANVSHDFKTPLTMIKAYASMIMEISGNIPEKRNKHAQVIVEESDRLASLVADVLDLSKLQSGLQTLNLKTVDMSSYLVEIVERFDYMRETGGYAVETGIEEGLFTKADEVKIGQALYNLIGNAINYTGADKKVYVRLEKVDETRFRFSVRDTGKGIKAEEKESIWERYYRSKDAHKRPVKGTGLGLSIVKAVLERHKFNFGVESELGKGSTFYIDFPLTGENA